MSKPHRIVLGVTGSIAAYRAAELASTLSKEGVEVDVVLTDEALRFITALTFNVSFPSPPDMSRTNTPRCTPM